MRFAIVLAAAAGLALALAAAAVGGGFATVGVKPLPSGEPVWTPTLVVRAHGVTPVDGLTPVIRLRHLRTGETALAEARATGNPGEYRARVEFSAPGTWSYEVGETRQGAWHTFRPVDVAAASAGEPGNPRWAAWAVAGTAVLVPLLLLGALLARRRRPPSPAAAAAD